MYTCNMINELWLWIVTVKDEDARGTEFGAREKKGKKMKLLE